ncbi:mediator complex subunit med4 [Cystoisospora suis]|uniref:Mediator complex subunit med4 n=1 Tax=Cystoisospora suis TaxID=483139 RepID=A0A2C6LE89_9APIC|nr:mediator complex subunit med4 [Cystoisospora suis]
MAPSPSSGPTVSRFVSACSSPSPSSGAPVSSLKSSSPYSLEELRRRLQDIVKPEWRDIPDTASEQWKMQFRESISEGHSSTSPSAPSTKSCSSSSSASSSSSDVPSTSSACPSSASSASPTLPSGLSSKSSATSFVNRREQCLHVLTEIASVLDTPWLVAQKRLEGINDAEKSRRLTLEEVVLYARRLGGSTAAPPETTNISDVVAHQAIYPTFHFLPYPSMEELQSSRLSFLASKPFDKVCFPPEIRTKLSYRVSRRETDASGRPNRIGGYEVRFVCQTPGCTIKYSLFDSVFGPDALPPESLWNTYTYNPTSVPFVTHPFPKTILAQAFKPPLQPSRPALLRVNLRSNASRGPHQQDAAARQGSRPSPRALGSAVAEPTDLPLATHSSPARVTSLPGRAGHSSPPDVAERKEAQGGRGELGASLGKEGPEGRAQQLGEESVGGGLSESTQAGTTPQREEQPRPGTGSVLAKGSELQEAVWAPDNKNGPSAMEVARPSASLPAHPSKPVSTTAMGTPSTAFHGLMLGSGRRRRKEVVQQEEAESSGSADSSSSSGEDSSEEEGEEGNGRTQ